MTSFVIHCPAPYVFRDGAIHKSKVMNKPLIVFSRLLNTGSVYGFMDDKWLISPGLDYLER